MGVGLFYGAFIFVTTLTSLRAMGVGLFYGAFIFVTTRNFPQGDGSRAVLRSVHICNYS